MTCAKRQVTATLVLPDGRRFVGTDGCGTPQAVCLRLPGEGYGKCASIYAQDFHAEESAIF